MPRRIVLEGRALILPAIVLAIALYILGRDAYIARRLHYDLLPTALAITYPRTFRIPYGEIRAVTYFRASPAVRGPFLSELGKSRIGSYLVDTVGRVKIYSAGISGPLLVIETPKDIYGLTPAAGEKFYQELLARLPRSQAGMSLGPAG